jgi:hypothetical protein
MNNKLLILFFLGILLIGTVSAEVSTLGTFKQNDCVQLKQTCASCTYVNFTRVSYPNSTTALSNVVATQDGVVYNYNFCSTSLIGTYIVEGVGDVDGTDAVFVYDFEITPNGFINSIGFYILILVLSLGIIFLGLAIKDAPITILGSLGLYFIGLYILFYGLVGMKDSVYTWAIGLIVLGLAFYISTKSTYELIENPSD